jgi:transposase
MPAYEPEMMFKILFLQFLYDISDRRVEEEVNFNLVLKWFVGLAIDESPPDSSSLTRLRDRLGEERFAQIFNQIVELAREIGLVSDRLSIVDSTHIKAKVDTFKMKRLRGSLFQGSQ